MYFKTQQKLSEPRVQHYSDNAMLQITLSHNSSAQWRKVVAFTSSSLKPLSHPKVMAVEVWAINAAKS
jgi:hypothetical protein